MGPVCFHGIKQRIDNINIDKKIKKNEHTTDVAMLIM